MVVHVHAPQIFLIHVILLIPSGSHHRTCLNRLTSHLFLMAQVVYQIYLQINLESYPSHQWIKFANLSL